MYMHRSTHNLKTNSPLRQSAFYTDSQRRLIASNVNQQDPQPGGALGQKMTENCSFESEYYENENTPLIKLIPVECDPQRSKSVLKIAIPIRPNRTLSPSAKSSDSALTLKERKAQLLQNIQLRKSFVEAKKLEKTDKAGLDIPSNKELDVNMDQFIQNPDIVQFSQGSSSSKLLYKQVLLQVASERQEQETDKREEDAEDKGKSTVQIQENCALRLIPVPMEENRSKSSLEKPNYTSSLISQSKIFRGSKTPQKYGAVNRDIKPNQLYDKLFKIRGSKIPSSIQDLTKYCTTTTTKNSAYESQEAKDYNIKSISRTKEITLKHTVTKYTSSDMHLLSPLGGQDSGLRSKSTVRTNLAIKGVGSMELDSKSELTPLRKGFLSKINNANYQLAKNYASCKNALGAFNNSQLKEIQTNILKHKREVSVGRNAPNYDLGKVKVSGSFFSNNKI